MTMPTPADAVTLPACPLCGQQQWQNPVARTTYYRCTGCALWYNGRSASRVEEEQLYDHCPSVPVQDQGQTTAGYWSQLEKLASARRQSPIRSVLDIGCGSGQFLGHARDAGARVAGLELDPVQVAACAARGIPVHAGSLFDIGAPRGPWQVVTFWDVLDHLESPVEALRLVIQELEPGGLVVARGRNGGVHVPLRAARNAHPTLFRALRVPDVSVVHRWGLAPAAWIGLFEAAGLENVRLYSGVPTPGDRYRIMGAAPMAGLVKRSLGLASTALSRLTGGRSYLFPSVLLCGQKPGSPKRERA